MHHKNTYKYAILLQTITILLSLNLPPIDDTLLDLLKDGLLSISSSFIYCLYYYYYLQYYIKRYI